MKNSYHLKWNNANKCKMSSFGDLYEDINLSCKFNVRPPIQLDIFEGSLTAKFQGLRPDIDTEICNEV